MERNSRLIGWLVLIVGLLCSIRGEAVDVNSESTLRSAINRGDSYIRLTGDISLGSTLTISKGTIILDLNGKTISLHLYNKKAETLIVSGGNVIITGNGLIKAHAQYKFGGVRAYDALALSYNGGTLSIHNAKFEADPFDLAKAYTLDPNNGKKVSDMIPFGAYIVGASSSDYESEGYPGNSDKTAYTTVSLINYNVTYNANGGTPQPANATYTIESSNLSLPKVSKEGYDFVGWKYGSKTYDGDKIEKDDLPTTTERASQVNMTFEAVWKAINYKIIYNTNGGEAIPEGSYTIESETITLPTPSCAKHLFKGWYTTEDCTGDPVTTIPKGSMGEKKFYAKWVSSYDISYELNGGNNPENVPNSFTEESETITLPTPTREGYTFDGWYLKNDFSGSKETEIKVGSKGDRTYYAKWTIENYELTYHLNGGVNPPDVLTSYTIETAVELPKPSREHYTFEGWFDNESLTGTVVASIVKGSTGKKEFYAKWTPVVYRITFETNGGTDQTELPYNIESETFQLPMKAKRTGYSFAGWYKDAGLTQAYGTSVVKGTYGDFTLYAKWILTEYKIEYDCYHGTNPADAPVKFTIEDNVILPVPQRDNFTFVGWHLDELLKDEVQTAIPVGTIGDRKFFAEWTMGNSVQITRPVNGTITVKNGSTEVKSGDKVGANTSLTITAMPASADYKLSKLIVNNDEYTTSPQTVKMPAEGGLKISAIFADPRQAALAPKITTNPVNTDYVPSGESVTVTLEKGGECDSLLYSVDGSTPKLYTGAFQVSTITTASKTVTVQAIARKAGYKDGITTRNITFRSGKITITFNLPKGIVASNPEGGEVVEAVATGGTFEFKLIVDKDYFQTLDSIKVTANGTVITPDVYGIYTLSDQTTDVAVNVTGISGVTHLITLVQSANGVIAFTGDEDAENSRTVNHGDPISVTATADENYKFQSWTDGETANPRTFMAESDVMLQARFVKDSAGFSVILPELEGVTVKPLTGYSTEVKPGGKFKFYLRLDADYSESVPVVYANNEKLTVNQEVYSLYGISENIRISVDGIVRNRIKPVLQEHVSAIDMETGSDISDLSLFTDALIVLRADAPEGQVFSKWNDGKADNPRIVTAADASQLFPLFLPETGRDAVCVKLPVLVGAGMGAVNTNAAAVAKGESVQLKLVVLPSYSQSDVKVFANGKELEPALSLRASSETKTLFYALSDLSEDITVEVSGLKLNEYVVSLEQQEGGTVGASQIGMVKHGTVITLTATPNQGNMFVKWEDGNTLNPYRYVVTDNCTLKGYFAASNMPVGNENISTSAVRIYVAGNSLHIQSPEASELSVWNLEGKLVKKAGVPAGYSSYLLPDGMYVMKVGNGESMKIIIR